MRILPALLFAAVAATQPYRLNFTCQRVTEGFAVFDIKVTDRATGETLVARKTDAAADLPAKIAATVDGKAFNIRALVRSDGRAEVALDVVENKATIQHTLLAGRAQTSKYSGEPISLNLRDADIKDVLHTFAELTGMNIAVDPAVNARVTIELVDVPWDQALDLILRQNKLMAVT